MLSETIATTSDNVAEYRHQDAKKSPQYSLYFVLKTSQIKKLSQQSRNITHEGHHIANPWNN